MMTGDQAQVGILIDETLTLLADCDPASNDPQFEDAWELFIDVTSMAGSRLLEHGFGELMTAADEVQLYLGQLDRVSRIAADAPFRVPAIALRPLKAAGRFVEDTTDTNEVCRLLTAAPQLAAGMSEFLMRTAGREARPALDLLDLAVRAGGVYRDSLMRAVPAAA